MGLLVFTWLSIPTNRYDRYTRNTLIGRLESVFSRSAILSLYSIAITYISTQYIVYIRTYIHTYIYIYIHTYIYIVQVLYNMYMYCIVLHTVHVYILVYQESGINQFMVFFMQRHIQDMR
jgi:hypothetical protein